MEGLTQKQIELNKQEIINLLSSTNREGINKLISYLEKEITLLHQQVLNII